MKEALKLALEALEKLWNIIDDIDTYGDMAKGDEKLYRALVERRQRTRFEETGISTDGYELTGGVITAIKAALAQPEQEPVAWAMLHDNGHFIDAIHPDEHARVEGKYTHPLYTTEQRTWVGLTDEEIQTEWVLTPQNDKAEGIWFGRRIEAKLKEKNA